MKINIAQLFVRKPFGATRKNTYLVCGIIQTDEPLAEEATHILTADAVNIHESQNVSSYSKGSGLDGIMTSPLWKVKLI